MSTYDAAWYGVVEAEHEFQNPVSLATILELGDQLDLNEKTNVIDVAAGRCGPAIALARGYGSRFVCVEQNPDFVTAARVRAHEAGVRKKVKIVHADATDYVRRNDRQYDAALCLGASFVFGGLTSTIDALFPIARFVAVGEPYTDLREKVRIAESTGLRVVSLLTSSEDDWRRYESLRLRTLEKWLRDHPQHRREYRDREMTAQAKRRTEQRGWAIMVVA